MRLGGIEVMKILGIRLRLDWSWFVVLLLLTWTFATFDFPFRAPGLEVGAYWGLGFAAAILLFLSVLIHELAHAVTARARGIPVERITLFIFGGVAEMRMEARRPLDEFVLTIVGPLASLGLAAGFWAVGIGAAEAGLDGTALLSSTLGRLNLILAVFNMVPAFPLDGGRVLRSALWRITGDLSRATRWAAAVGRLFGWLLIAWGVWLFVVVDARLAGAWSIFLGWFLAGAARGAIRHNRWRGIRTSLAAYPVTAAVEAREAPVSAAATVEDLLRSSLLVRPGRARLVVRDGHAVGVVTVEDAAHVPAEERAEVPVFEIMTPLSDVVRFPANARLVDAAETLSEDTRRVAIVAATDGAYDVLTLADVERWIDRLETLDG